MTIQYLQDGSGEINTFWTGSIWSGTPANGDTVILGRGTYEFTEQNAMSVAPALFRIGRGFDGSIGRDGRTYLMGDGSDPKWDIFTGQSIKIGLRGDGANVSGGLRVAATGNASVDISDERPLDGFALSGLTTMTHTASIAMESSTATVTLTQTGAQDYTRLVIVGANRSSVDITGCTADELLIDGPTVIGGTATDLYVFSGDVSPENCTNLYQYNGLVSVGKYADFTPTVLRLIGGTFDAEEATYDVTWPSTSSNVWASSAATVRGSYLASKIVTIGRPVIQYAPGTTLTVAIGEA